MNQAHTPKVVHLLAEDMWEKAQKPKPTALGTPLRYSSSFGCERSQGYAALDALPTEPVDIAGAWVMGIGTLVHEHLQDTIARLCPDAEFEVASGTDFVSGSCDALIPVSNLGGEAIGGTHVLFELKTMGTYSFDKQVGWNRMRSTFNTPEGPALKAIAQAGMNALGIEGGREGVEIEWVVMGSLTFEALSQQKAERMGVSDELRFSAEWWVPRNEWEPVALQELQRMSDIHATITSGYLPDRIARDDDALLTTLNPESSRDWQCVYCSYRSLCIEDGASMVPIPSTNLVRRNQD